MIRNPLLTLMTLCTVSYAGSNTNSYGLGYRSTPMTFHHHHITFLKYLEIRDWATEAGIKRRLMSTVDTNRKISEAKEAFDKKFPEASKKSSAQNQALVAANKTLSDAQNTLTDAYSDKVPAKIAAAQREVCLAESALITQYQKLEEINKEKRALIKDYQEYREQCEQEITQIRENFSQDIRKIYNQILDNQKNIAALQKQCGTISTAAWQQMDAAPNHFDMSYTLHDLD